jgi:AraC family transcriptional regulator of adaptative response / DNA-3-methyladenine glycosylase II
MVQDMLPAAGILEEARKARDPRFDGRFFVGVRTTGIYCRPVCPVKMPRAENVTFYDSAAAASEAGYRPCLRCRPESSPGTPAWMGTSTTVARALRLIQEGALDDGSVKNLSDRLGVTSRHLARLFTRHLGASPKTIAQTRRLHFAKKLIDETNLPMTEIAMSAAYGSIRRFNDHFLKTYGKSPGTLRKENQQVEQDRLVLKIPYRQPYDFSSLLSFYRVRGTPGVETVSDNTYSRSFFIDEEFGRFEVTDNPESSQLLCAIEGGNPRSLMAIAHRVKRMFDVDAIPEEINRVLCRDAALKKLVKRHPGQRLPGAFDPFEVAVRAIVGQQISVKGATTVMGRIAERYGAQSAFGQCFPDEKALVDLDTGSLSMPEKRATAIRELARRVVNGEVVFDLPDEDVFIDSVVAIPGIGPWTAEYMALRARANPDAFLNGDLGIRKAALEIFGIDAFERKQEIQLLERAENWRPWRGYAGMHLWRSLGDEPVGKK